MKSLVISVVLLLTAIFVIPGSNANARMSGCDGDFTNILQAPSTADEAGSGEACNGGETGTFQFDANSSKLNSAVQDALKALADKMRAHPDCKVIILGSAGGSKFTQQLNWERINNVILFMNDVNGVDRNRFIFQLEGTARDNNVNFTFVSNDTEGPSSISPPHPDLSR